SPCLSRSPKVIITKEVQTNFLQAEGFNSDILHTQASKLVQTNFLWAMGFNSDILCTRAGKLTQT
ncbi:hypothetical protein K443DRAFT_41414, partial [Laccaria amethystina LaAM-08-1]